MTCQKIYSSTEEHSTIHRINFDAAALAIDHFVSIRYEDSETGDLLRAGYYPNSAGRPEMDITRATVDMNGEGLKAIQV
jgi:hypothetical protein